MARDYQRHDIYTFGAHLLNTGDLDPVYIMLHKAELPSDQLKRWLVAYWCLYHCGAASWLSDVEGPGFWVALYDAASNEDPAPTGGRWPRGHERRHFRGEAAKKAVGALGARFPEAEDMVDWIVGESAVVPAGIIPRPFTEFAGRAMELPLFGPWMGFKICDMIDRVLEVPVDFTQAAVFMFKDPRQAAFMLWRLHAGMPPTARPKDEEALISKVVDHLLDQFQTALAPPSYDRFVNLQEIETILCKWKSHMNGHYPLNNDIDEIRDGLRGWGRTAELLQAHLPKGMR